ncbi:MAG: sigma 54-interacting transcriptional regulator [Desulfarculaceae bacterium]|nr:sigma 54-interacting transcriptional regulator [Desulfarculaceae bacterium]MCF8074289.1 sigma 54-interacting transcriptional regulator [Desulfarculaceae bacterium]MCF8103357.1 sigma 54-interacting transcriptional regulator [Desulfarculaceae bacterium]MCF8117853.1 sigma 54-interacting transcriptional regulator [Desulfarculaceae bacterium]
MNLSFDKMAPLRQLLESAHNGVVVVDRQGFVVLYNQAARTIANFAHHEILGRHIGDVSQEAWAEMKQIMNTGLPHIGRKVKLGESTIIANRTPIQDQGNIVGVLSIFQDFSEYENLADQLAAYKEVSEQLDVIIESSHDGLWISDASGEVIKVNAASAKGTGLKPGELVGRNVEELVEEGLFDRSATLEVLASRAPVTFVQNQRDGGQCLVTGTPVFKESGEVRLVVINARDLTELNRLQAELEESRLLTQQYRSELSLVHLHQDLASQVVMRSPVMMRAFDTAMRVAQVDSSVLLAGESGVGKGLFARLIHEASPRKEGPLVRVDCGGIPANLIEAELFGYERGAFTGALESGKLGYFELAQGGTLLLDEVGELPMSVQAKLLRFLEDNEVVRVGSTTPRRIDVRIIAATNRELDRMVAEHQFRQDLYFRLKVVPLNLSPLRERREDVPPLLHHFLEQFNEKCGADKILSPAALDALCRYTYPGNVRELANLVEQLVVLSPGPRIDREDLPPSVRAPEAGSGAERLHDELNLNLAVEAVEKEMIHKALRAYGSQRKAAARLGINHSTLSRKMSRYGMGVE